MATLRIPPEDRIVESARTEHRDTRRHESTTAQASRGLQAPVSSRQQAPATAAHLLQFQRTVGNRAVQRLLQAHYPAGSDAPKTEQVAPVRDANGVAPAAAVAVQHAASDASQSLPGDLQKRFESALGVGLGGVRLHTGAASAAAAQAVGASAYTVGQDIHFNAGEYSPASPEGQHLLAHEVAHTVQQGTAGGAARTAVEVSTPQDAAEVEAEQVATSMLADHPASVSFDASLTPIVMREAKKDTIANASLIHGLIAAAASRGERDRLQKIGTALDAAAFPQEGAGVGQGGVTIDGQSFIVDCGDLPTLRGSVVEAMNHLDEPIPTAPKAAASAAAPARKGTAAKPSPSSGAGWVHELIAIAAKANDGTRLKETQALLWGGQSTLTYGDQSATTVDVQIEDKEVKLTEQDIEALLGECDAALKLISISGKLPEGATGSMRLILALPGGKVFASSDKFSDGDFVLKTTAPTEVILEINQTALSISFEPAIMLDANFFFSGNVLVHGLDFNFANAALSMRSERDFTGFADPTDDLFAKLQAKVLAALAGTPLAEKGYSPLTDGDLAGTLAKVKANLAAMPGEPMPAPQAGRAGAGGAEEEARDRTKAAEEAKQRQKEQEEAADPARVHPEDVTLKTIVGILTMKNQLLLSLGGGGILIPAGTKFTLSATTTGQPGQPGPGGPLEISNVSLSTSGITLLDSGKPVAHLTRLMVHSGGSVTIEERDVRFIGPLDKAAGGELVLTFFFRLAGGDFNIPTKDQAVMAGVGRKMLEEKIGSAIRNLIIDNRKALGDDLDLAEAMGIK